MSEFDANRLTVYPDNSYVLVEHFDGAMGKRAPTKFHPVLKGPYRVINHNDHDEYTLQNLVTDKLEKIPPYLVTTICVRWTRKPS